MAVAHESATESHTGTTGSTSEASFDISVPFTSSSKAIWVGTSVVGATGDLATSVKIDPAGVNTDVPAVSGGRAVDTAGEPGDAKLFFLDGGLPTTTTTVRVNRTNNAEVMYAVVGLVTGSGTLEVVGIVLLENDGAVAEQNVDDGSPGTNSQRYAFGYSGALALTGGEVGANSTLLHSIDFGPRVAGSVRETTAGQGSRPVGFVFASDDRAFVHFAIREVAGGGATVTPAVVATTSTVPTPNVLAGATVTPAAVVTVSTVPTPSVLAGALVQPAVVVTTTTVPTPVIQAGAVVTPATVATSSTVPTPAILAGAVVAPATVATSSTIPTPTISIEGGATVTPAVVATTSTVPTPSVQAGAVVTPGVVSTVSTVPTPTIDVAGGGLVTPAVVATISTIPTPTVSAGAVVSPNVVVTVSTVPTPTVQGGVAVQPATVVTVTTVPTPTVTAGAVVTPNVVVTVSTVPTPFIQVGEPPSVDLPASAVIGERNPEGAISHRNREGVLSARDRTGTISQ